MVATTARRGLAPILHSATMRPAPPYRRPHGHSRRNPQHGAVLRLREHRARRARREVREVRHQARARAAAAQGPDRGQEGVLRLGPLQGVEALDARGGVRADRDPARAPVGQELRRHPDGGRRARPLLHEEPRRHVRADHRRLRLLAARVEAARERQGGDRGRRQELDLRPPDRQLRRVHLLRRPGARAAEADGQAPAARSRRRRRRSRRPPPTTTRSRKRSIS